MIGKTRMIAIVSIGILLSACGLGQASQAGSSFPDHDITLIVPYGPGGSTDQVARAIAEVAELELGHKIVVVNKPGAAAAIGTGEVLSAKPDGYTIGLATDNGLVFQPTIQKLAWNTTADYQPIIKLGDAPFILAIPEGSPWKTMDDFISAAKDQPGKVRIAVSGKLTPPDLITNLLMYNANVQLTSVPFSGGGAEALAAVLGNHIEAIIESVSGTIAQIQAGKLRALAVFADSRVPLISDVPTSVELGYKTVLPSKHLIVGPAGMDKAVVDRLYAAFSKGWHSEKFQKFLNDKGYQQVSEPPGPDALTKELNEVADAYAQISKLTAPSSPQ